MVTIRRAHLYKEPWAQCVCVGGGRDHKDSDHVRAREEGKKALFRSRFSVSLCRRLSVGLLISRGVQRRLKMLGGQKM